MNNDQAHDVLMRHAVMLGEHFQAVEIIACRRNPDGSDSVVRFEGGTGSWFERFGLVRSWMVRHEESEKEIERKRRTNNDDETQST